MRTKEIIETLPYQCVGKKAIERYVKTTTYGTFAYATNVSVASIRASAF